MPNRFSSFPRRVLPLASVVGVCLLGLVVSLRPLVGWDGSRLPGDLIDSRFIGYVLEHGFLWLMGRADSFWSAPFYYPMTRTIALSDNMAGALPLYTLLRLFTPTPEQGFLALMVVCFVLNFALAVACCRGFGAGLGASLVAAYPVAFGFMVAAQARHPQYLLLYPLLLALLLLGRFLVRPGPGRAVWVVVGETVLLVSSFYYGVLFALLAGVTTLLVLAVGGVRPGALGRAVFLRPWQAGLAAACLLALMADYLPYYRTSLLTGSWSGGQVQAFAPSLAGLLTPPEGSLVWGWLGRFVHPGPERILFPGLFPLVGLGCGGWLLWRRRDAASTVAGALAVAGLLCCLALLDVWGPGNVVRRLPGLASLRVTARVTVVALPCFALCLALGLDRATRRLAPWQRGGVLLVVLGLLVVDQFVAPAAYPSYAWRQSRQRVAALMRRVPPEARIFYVRPAVPQDDPDYWAVHLDAMLAAQRLGKATYNGYSSWLPPLLGLYFATGTCARLDAWRDAAACLDHPGLNWRALYAGEVVLGGAACPPDPDAMSRPQVRQLRPLAERDRRADIRARAAYDAGQQRLRVEAAIRNLGRRAIGGLGDFSHRFAVFWVAEVLDATGRRTSVPLGRLDRAIAPGQRVVQHAEAVLPAGVRPRRVRLFLSQAGGGPFSMAGEDVFPVVGGLRAAATKNGETP